MYTSPCACKIPLVKYCDTIVIMTLKVIIKSIVALIVSFHHKVAHTL